MKSLTNYYVKKSFSNLCWHSFYQKIKSIRITSIACSWYLRASSWSIEPPVGIDIGQNPSQTYRFSAFWLRSKCSICSYQLNIWYGLHSRSRILNWFLTDWIHGWACSPGPAGCHGLALPPWAASFSLQNKSLFAYCCLWKVHQIYPSTIKYKQPQRTRSIRFFSSLNVIYLLSYHYPITSHFCLD